MLKQRVITAVLMIIVLGAGIIWLPLNAVALLFAALVAVAAWEWAGLAAITTAIGKALFMLLAIALIVGLSLYSQLFDPVVNSERLRDILGVACAWWAIALLWVRSYPASAVLWRKTWARLVMGLLVLVPTWFALMALRLHPQGVGLIFVLIALVTAADIGAYFTGKAWGKAKLAPNVSPGKSWAGFWGGLTASTMLALALWWLLDDDRHSGLAVMAIAVATSLASVLGDLLESMIKREQGVKDSGRILPGHGGILDRLDSMTAAAPVFALCLLLAGW